MTTGWGSTCDLAPRLAYELAALVADGDEAGVAGLWGPLDARARARVLAALGAQARYEAHGAGRLAAAAEQLLADLRHCDARQAAVHALTGSADAVLPACDGCPRPAAALARARLALMAGDAAGRP
jgi:hypothetical protein